MRDESLLLEDMTNAATRLLELGAGRTSEELAADRALTESVLYNMIVLGEASKRLTGTVRRRFADVDWSGIARTRDYLVHHYEGVEWETVDRVLHVILPTLLPRLVEIRDTLRTEFDAAQD